MRYQQITREERYTLATLRKQEPKLSNRAIARLMERHPSTICREVKRNSTPYDGAYRPSRAQEQANGRRSRSRRNSRFTPEHWQAVEQLLRADLSPEQISGRLRRDQVLQISHETIYQRVWADKRRGGTLFRRLRQRPRYRKRYGTNEKRGRLPGKRHISERPAAVEQRQELGHWEMDTVIGSNTNDCILTLVERRTGCVLIAKLPARNAAAVNRRLLQIISEQPHLFRTITVDNGTEFHAYEQIERLTGVLFYFATPYHSWERGTNEHTNALIRQYLPKRTTMKASHSHAATRSPRSSTTAHENATAFSPRSSYYLVTSVLQFKLEPRHPFVHRWRYCEAFSGFCMRCVVALVQTPGAVTGSELMKARFFA